MSPTSSSSTIYDHLMINFHQQPKVFTRTSSETSKSVVKMNRFSSSSHGKSSGDPLFNRKSIPPDEQVQPKRRYTITHTTIPEPIIRCSVSNQVYEKGIGRKVLTPSDMSVTSYETNQSTTAKTNPKYIGLTQLTASPSLSTNVERQPTDFRPLIIHGRRRFSTLPSSSPMIIVKKKSPSPMQQIPFEQKPIVRSLPVNITSSNPTIVVSTVIPSSLSFSSSCSSSTSTCSTNVGSVSVPIQVTKTPKNNNHHYNNNNTNSTTATTIQYKKGYRFVQRSPPQANLLTNVKVENQVQPRRIRINDDDQSLRMPSSSSSTGGETRTYHVPIMADSNVLRLIRRYDPLGANAVVNKSRRSLEHTRGEWPSSSSSSNSTSHKAVPPFLSNISSASCSYLPQRIRNSTHDDNGSIRQSSTPRLERQRAIHEPEILPSSPNGTNSIQPPVKPILDSVPKELPLSSNQIEPLTIEIEPYVSPPPVTSQINGTTYQPLITTGTKRVCSAISKSEWDLRLQPDSNTTSPSLGTPVSSHPVPSLSTQMTGNQQRSVSSYRPLFGRSKSTAVIANDHEQQDDDIDDCDENSAPSLAGSSIDKLKKIFNIKPSIDSTTPTVSNQHRISSIDSNLNRRLNGNGTDVTKTDSISSISSITQKNPDTKIVEAQPLKMSTTTNGIKPMNHHQEMIPSSSPSLSRIAMLKSQKNFPSAESLNPSNNSSLMPSSELLYDAYRFRRLNEQDQMTSATNSASRLRNIAKVEPYSVNTNMIRPLYQSSSSPSSTKQPSMKPMSTTTTTGTTSTITGPTTAVSSQTRAILNSMGNTPTPSSTSSSAGSLTGMIRHPNVRYSDFLVPHPTYSTAPTQSQTVAVSNRSQPLSNSSSYANAPSTSILLSESLSYDSSHRLPNNNPTFYSGRSTSVAPSINDHQQKHRSFAQGDFHSTKDVYSPPKLQHNNGTSARHTNANQYEKFDNYNPPISYHYRQRQYPSSMMSLNTSVNNDRDKSQGSVRSTLVEQRQSREDDRIADPGQQQQQPRRRFHRRKQMKRSKSADLYQEPSSSMHSKSSTHQPNYYLSQSNQHETKKLSRQQRSISRDLIGNSLADGNLSSSSSASSTSTANIERINRAALLRYKSLDSMTFNNRKATSNGKNSNRRMMSKPMTMDFDSDDSVCGIPKPRKTIGR